MLPSKLKIEYARKLRRRSTPAEQRAWRLLRNRRFFGFKFRRQHVIRGFIVDFYCHELNLILELDGRVHDAPARMAYDARRTAILELLGYRIVRMRNREVSQEGLARCLAPFLPPASQNDIG